MPAAIKAVEQTQQELAAEFSIHPGRVFLAGCGEAGALALTVGLTHTAGFAGAAAIDSGPVPLMLLLREFRRMKSRRAFLAASGGGADARAFEELSDLLTTAGTDVTTHRGPSENSRDATARSLNEWMMRIVSASTDRQIVGATGHW